jgi:hypothetical protein
MRCESGDRPACGRRIARGSVLAAAICALAWVGLRAAAQPADHQCQLFGYVFSAGDESVLATLCAGLREESLPDRASPSRDGWGLGYFFAPPQSGRSQPLVLRGGPPACEDSARWNAAIDEVDAFGLGAPATVLGHVRKSSYGPDDGALPDPHPFADSLGGRWWLFAHNGHMVPDTLRAWIPEDFIARHPIDYDEVLIDSEWLFRYCLYEIERAGDTEVGLSYACRRVKNMPDFVFNICLTDGDTLWAAHSVSYTPFYYQSEAGQSAWWAATVRGAGSPSSMRMHRLYWFTPGAMGSRSYE